MKAIMQATTYFPCPIDVAKFWFNNLNIEEDLTSFLITFGTSGDQEMNWFSKNIHYCPVNLGHKITSWNTISPIKKPRQRTDFTNVQGNIKHAMEDAKRIYPSQLFEALCWYLNKSTHNGWRHTWDHWEIPKTIFGKQRKDKISPLLKAIQTRVTVDLQYTRWFINWN